MKIYLAPMEGLTGYVFRNALDKNFGSVDRYFTPFIASEKLNSREKNDVRPEHNTGMNVVPQILTNRAEEFVKIALQLQKLGYTEVNLNLGCPSGTVVTKNRGAGFLSVPDELNEFLSEIYEKCPIKISIKTRIGFNDPYEFNKLMDIYNRYPVSELIIHPRTAKEFYKGEPHVELMEQIISESRHNICYNGNINSVLEYKKISERLPQISKIMIGRGAIANPGLIREIKTGKKMTVEELKVFHKELYDKYKDVMGNDRNLMFKMKEVWVYLSRNFESSDKVLTMIRRADNAMDYEITVRNILKNTAFIST